MDVKGITELACKVLGPFKASFANAVGAIQEEKHI